MLLVRTSSRAYDGAEILKGASHPVQRGGAIAAPGRADHSGPSQFGRGAASHRAESRPKHQNTKGCPKSLTRRKMILTQCAVCATDLGLSSGKKRPLQHAIGPACQKKHWEEGGHDQLCKKIKKAAVLYPCKHEAHGGRRSRAQKCADHTAGQAAHCTQALHLKTKEGPCAGARRGTAGFAR